MKNQSDIFFLYRQVPNLRQGGLATDRYHPIRVANRYLTIGV